MSERKLPMGVYPAPSSPGRVVAAIRHNGKRHYLGSFATVEEASEKVRLFRKEHPRSTNGPWQPGDKL